MNRFRRHSIFAASSLVFTMLTAASVMKPSLILAGEHTGRCDASVKHPLEVRVTALDPVRRGADLRLRISASSRVGLGRTEVRMVSEGGAIRRGAGAASLGTLGPGRWASTIFTVRVPQNGNRFYIQFQVTGDGPRGPITRGACFNVLPDGPLESGRVVDTPDGRRVVEVAARRID